jgi:hypothetical protein
MVLRDLPMKRPYATALILLVLVALVAQGACLPHTHTASGVGLFNQEHDLTLLATAGMAGPLPIGVLLLVVMVTVSRCVSALPAPALFASRDAESRAPPA